MVCFCLIDGRLRIHTATTTAKRFFVYYNMKCCRYAKLYNVHKHTGHLDDWYGSHEWRRFHEDHDSGRIRRRRQPQQEQRIWSGKAKHIAIQILGIFVFFAEISSSIKLEVMETKKKKPSQPAQCKVHILLVLRAFSLALDEARCLTT